jgi:ATP-binding cassette subfamily B protein
VRDYRIEDLRNGIGMVLQNNVLFTGTIRENISWGKADATDEEIIVALKAAQAWDFVSEMPQGLDTFIQQGGTNVSGGQKQRLCIARAMLKHPAILILDDSTSAVDSDTEGRIRASFQQELADTTVFIIAQRISSVVSADKIVVLDEGGIESVGTHDQLMKTSPIYQDIYTSQVKEALSNG